VTQALLQTLGQPLIGTTLILPGESEPMNDPQQIREHFQKTLQAIIDAGACPMQPTTVIDLESGTPVVVRTGRGELARLGLSPS
jgi:tRNA A37 threonylcarbamoyladenosine synthetase subunit TsaC/SUA5/YrdC